MAADFEFGDGVSRRLERVYQTPDMVTQRREVREAMELAAGHSVLDIGSGPGLLVHEIAERVGATGSVRGVDLSDDMLAMAAKRCAGQPWVSIERGDATQLPFDDESFDRAVSTQVYEYIADIPAALAELHRVLRPGGRAVILDTDYGSLVIHTEDEARMARVLAAWDEHFVHADLPRWLSPRLRDAGFTLGRSATIPIFNTEYDPDSFSHGFTGLVAGFVAGRQGVSAEEAQAWADELRELGARGDYFFSLNRYLFVANKA